SAAEPVSPRDPTARRRRGPGGPTAVEGIFQPRAKHTIVTSRVASQRSLLAREEPILQKNFVDKLWVRHTLSRPIPFVKQPVFATERSNSPGDRVLTGCRPVASWAKLV